MDDGRSVPIPGFLFLYLCRNLFGRLRIPVAFRRTVPVRIRFFRRYARRLCRLMQCADLYCIISCCLSRFLPFAERCMLPNC